MQWVAEHYGEEVHISDAAQLVPCSESHFMRWFRQMTGQSFIAFLKEYRLNAAAEALHTTDDTVLTIASRCGFENLSYFNRAFKLQLNAGSGNRAECSPSLLGIPLQSSSFPENRIASRSQKFSDLWREAAQRLSGAAAV